MSRRTVAVLAELEAERRYQEEQHTDESDDARPFHEFVARITGYLGAAAVADDPDTARERMVKVGALAVATIEAIDRRIEGP